VAVLAAFQAAQPHPVGTVVVVVRLLALMERQELQTQVEAVGPVLAAQQIIIQAEQAAPAS
jgi:hypothetical protein